MCASTVYCIFDAAAYRRARDVKEQDILDKFAFWKLSHMCPSKKYVRKKW